MPVSRTYRCDEGHTFDFFHLRRDEPYPDCPVCAGVVQSMPGRFNIGTNRSKAMDIAQGMAEREFGMTDMADNQREGDIAAKGPAPMHTAEAEALTRQMKEAHDAAHSGPATDAPPNLAVSSFWQPNSVIGDPKAYSAPGSAETSAAGLDPVSLVDKSGTRQRGPVDFTVVAK